MDQLECFLSWGRCFVLCGWNFHFVSVVGVVVLFQSAIRITKCFVSVSLTGVAIVSVDKTLQ